MSPRRSMPRLPGWCGTGAPGAVPTVASRHVTSRTDCKADERILSPFSMRADPRAMTSFGVVGSETAEVTAQIFLRRGGVSPRLLQHSMRSSRDAHSYDDAIRAACSRWRSRSWNPCDDHPAARRRAAALSDDVDASGTRKQE